MAQIDLKNATIKVIDGDSRTGAVNYSTGYAAGVTTIVVDGFSAAIAAGRKFHIGADSTIYTISSSTGGATPTSLTFAPALADSAANDAVVTIEGNQLEINVGEGNLTFTETVAREYKKNRGRLDTVRNGDEEPVEVSFELTWEYYEGTGSSDITPLDALKRKNGASAWVTASSDACEPYCVNIEVLYEPDCASGVSSPNERIVFPQFRYESINGDLTAGTLSVSGKCNVVEPEIARES